MHRLKVASKETGKGRAPEHKPEWVAALEHNDMVQLGELAKHGFHPSIFEGHVTTLEINGKVDTVGRLFASLTPSLAHLVDAAWTCVCAGQRERSDAAAVGRR
jgi:hypothetical protein